MHVIIVTKILNKLIGSKFHIFDNGSVTVFAN
jgi:hypothetical protein